MVVDGGSGAGHGLGCDATTAALPTLSAATEAVGNADAPGEL
mgnify:CR=1 FL=1